MGVFEQVEHGRRGRPEHEPWREREEHEADDHHRDPGVLAAEEVRHPSAVRLESGLRGEVGRRRHVRGHLVADLVDRCLQGFRDVIGRFARGVGGVLDGVLGSVEEVGHVRMVRPRRVGGNRVISRVQRATWSRMRFWISSRRACSSRYVS